MYPPGRVIFIRPLKQLVGRRHRAGPRRLEKGWDAVWVTPKELIAEGILISGKVRAPPLHACASLRSSQNCRGLGYNLGHAQGAHRGGHSHLRQGAFSPITCMRLPGLSPRM